MTENRYAVLIASSRFQNDNLEDLACPENDVDGLNEIISSKNYCKFTETYSSKNEPHHYVLEKIEGVIEKASKNDLILIYYSGHGKQDRTGKLHLVTTDTKVNRLKSTSIPLESIKSFT